MSDLAEAPAKLVPDPDGRNADFYRHAATGQLHIQQCNACGHHHHPPRYLCGECGSHDLRFAASPGRGRIFSWTVTHRPVDAAWAREIPYATVVVAMDEGPRLVGALRGIDPSALELDLPVRAEIERVSDEFARIYFLPDLAPGEGLPDSQPDSPRER